MQQHHVGVFRVDAVERRPDGRVIVAVEPAGEGDLGALGQERFQIGPALRSEMIAAVNQGRS